MGEPFTIQISSNLVNRLVEDSDKSKKKTKKLKPKVQPQTKLHQKQASDDSETRKGPASAGWPLQPPVFLPVRAPQSINMELEAIRSVIRESDRVLEKLQKHEEDKLNEVTQRAKQLHEKEFKLPYQKPMPCLAEKDACLACYKEHVGDPLKCADAVKRFQDCARRVRQQV
ncbi:hypothetical protein Ancab_016891 [Ancistrocladus abbreviatus]